MGSESQQVAILAGGSVLLAQLQVPSATPPNFTTQLVDMPVGRTSSAILVQDRGEIGIPAQSASPWISVSLNRQPM